MYPFANKGMTGNFTILADGRSFLNFYKGSDLRVIVDAASIYIHKIKNLHILANLYIIYALLIVIDSYCFHFYLIKTSQPPFLIDLSDASNIFTTSRPIS